MKYIRTKNGRIIKVAISKEEYERDYKNSNVSYEEWFGCLSFGLDIVKQADTIDELCDEVCCDNEVQLLVNIYTNETKAQMIRNTIEQLFCKGKKDVYGAIWTDKGLIYVAKMNEKGELELI